MGKATEKRELSFEEAVGKLEALVEKMEAGDLPLEGILATYEEGMALVALCARQLEAAEKKIELLTKDKSGNLSRSEFSAEPDDLGTSVDETPEGEELF
ncbi:MAG: hypothetical protein OHK005_05360 [Candidatus Methylacidiphilales bacterium]